MSSLIILKPVTITLDNSFFTLVTEFYPSDAGISRSLKIIERAMEYYQTDNIYKGLLVEFPDHREKLDKNRDSRKYLIDFLVERLNEECEDYNG